MYEPPHGSATYHTVIQQQLLTKLLTSNL